MRETNLHHIFFTRADWTATKVNKLTRDHTLSKTEMYIPTHTELHRFVEPVKAPVTREMSERLLWMVRNMPARYTSLDAAKSLREDTYGTELQYIGENLNRQIPFLELSAKALKRIVI